MRTCPFCAERIQDKAGACRYCGRDLPAQSVTTPFLQGGLVVTETETPQRPESLEASEKTAPTKGVLSLKDPLPPEVETLLNNLGSRSSWIRKEAADALGTSGVAHPRVVEGLTLRRDTDDENYVRNAAARALAKLLGGTPTTNEAKAPAACEPAPMHAQSKPPAAGSAEIEHRPREADMLEELVLGLKSERPVVRYMAVKGLGEHEALPSSALAALAGASADSDVDVAQAANEFLSSYFSLKAARSTEDASTAARPLDGPTQSLSPSSPLPSPEAVMASSGIAAAAVADGSPSRALGCEVGPDSTLGVESADPPPVEGASVHVAAPLAVDASTEIAVEPAPQSSPSPWYKSWIAPFILYGALGSLPIPFLGFALLIFAVVRAYRLGLKRGAVAVAVTIATGFTVRIVLALLYTVVFGG